MSVDVARNVDNGLRFEGEELGEEESVAAFARRVDEDGRLFRRRGNALFPHDVRWFSLKGKIG